MISQSIHKFVLICLFENFDTAAGVQGDAGAQRTSN